MAFSFLMGDTMLMRKLSFILAIVMLLSALSGCAQTATEATVLEAAQSDIDFSLSNYKHITNGGVTDHDTLPYNIDAITGATQTVEGPGVITSIPLSVREIENAKKGLARGKYEDSKGVFYYEGMDLYSMLNEMREGDNGIVLTDNAYSVALKNANRETIATLTLEEIEAAHEAGRPVLIAYGIGDEKGSVVAPFVFDGKNEDSHSLGYVEELDNEDGCLKLVYDKSVCGAQNDYDTFSNVAYIYIKEKEEPGFKHTADPNSVYADPKYADYYIVFRGEALGREYVMSVKQLEQLAAYDEKGALLDGGIGYASEYSLANNAYWYVNTYEGLELYKLLQYLGMPDAETMGLAAARTTMVNFVAADGVPSTETFSIDTLSYPDAFGFYKKSATDPGDGTYVSEPSDLVDSGYPVLLAYGVNNYPYTITKNDNGYLSGLSNNGGPMRVVFGKTMYNHANGSRQVQYVREILVGEDRLYNTHFASEDAAINKLSDSSLRVAVNGSGEALMESAMSVKEIESLIYGEEAADADKKAIHIRNRYDIAGEQAYFEGVAIDQFLMETLGLPGTTGAVTFVGEKDRVTVSLDSLLAESRNGDVCSIIAFSKNGSPLVAHSGDEGYLQDVSLHPFLASDADKYVIKNSGGPLMAILKGEDGSMRAVENLTALEVEIEADTYAHLSAPYDSLSAETVLFTGEGLAEEKSYTVAELESRQRDAVTLDYSLLDEDGNMTQERYRGLYMYEIFSEIGIHSNAGDVTLSSADGSTVTVPLSLVKGQRFENYVRQEASPLWSMLCFGKGDIDGDAQDGTPLTSEGPLCFIAPQRDEDDINASLCLNNVVKVSVGANDVDTWSHSMSDVFSEFLDYEFTLTLKNEENEWSHVFKLSELEQMKQLILRDDYTVLDIGTCEGLDLWKFVKYVAKDQVDLLNPVSVTAYAIDGYKNDLLANFYMDGLENGVVAADGSRKPILLCYAVNGYPLVDDEGNEGYTGIAGNTAGPLRCVAENVQGASVKYLSKLVVTLPGTDALDISVEEGAFGQ